MVSRASEVGVGDLIESAEAELKQLNDEYRQTVALLQAPPSSRQPRSRTRLIRDKPGPVCARLSRTPARLATARRSTRSFKRWVPKG